MSCIVVSVLLHVKVYSFKWSLLLCLLLTLYQLSRMLINGFSAAGPGLFANFTCRQREVIKHDMTCLILLIRLGESCFFPSTPFTLLVILSCLVNASTALFLAKFLVNEDWILTLTSFSASGNLGVVSCWVGWCGWDVGGCLAGVVSWELLHVEGPGCRVNI